MKRILIVDEDRDSIEALNHLLSREKLFPEGCSTQVASDAESALHRVKAWKPHLVAIDLSFGGDGLPELVQRIRGAGGEDYVSVLLSSARSGPEELARAALVGADDLVSKPFRPEEIRFRARSALRAKEAHDSLKRANHRIEELSTHDDLTGLMNVRALYRRGEDEISKAKRFRKPISALLINVDGFSEVNRQQGFLVGNVVLKETGLRIKSCIRSIDVAARVGADEFLVLLVETDLAGAEFMAERVRDAISSKEFKNEGHSVRISACIGVAGFTHEQAEHQMSDLIHIASEALHSAKSAGPNSIEVYSFA